MPGRDPGIQGNRQKPLRLLALDRRVTPGDDAKEKCCDLSSMSSSGRVGREPHHVTRGSSVRSGEATFLLFLDPPSTPAIRRVRDVRSGGSGGTTQAFALRLFLPSLFLIVA